MLEPASIPHGRLFGSGDAVISVGAGRGDARRAARLGAPSFAWR